MHSSGDGNSIKRNRVCVAAITFCLVVLGCTADVSSNVSALSLATVVSSLTPTTTAIPNKTAITPAISPSNTAMPSATRVAPTNTHVPTPTSTATLVPMPELTLNKGSFYWQMAGTQTFIFSRNAAGYTTSHYDRFLNLTHNSGGKLVRIQLDSLGMGYTNTGAVDEAWAKQWDYVFEKAYANGILIIPVFSGWFDWNDSSGYSTWKSNPLNQAKGGFVKIPAELFDANSPAQAAWLAWLKTLVRRWHSQKNIAAWEIFSEVNLVPDVSESQGIEFVNRSASVIRAADSVGRPVTASLADDGRWSNFYRRTNIDFANVHPYPPSGQLDRRVIASVRQILAAYNKPVLIGESGLSAEPPDSSPPTLTTAAQAAIGIRHAIWASIVSGAMNGRSLYWEDGFAVYFQALGMPFMTKYADADLAASNFVRGVDFASFKPLSAQSSPEIFGAVVGHERMVIGWFRDSKCEPPDWNVMPLVSKLFVTIRVPGSVPNWQVDFFNTNDGTTLTSTLIVARNGNNITIALPTFTDAIAFKMYAK